MAWEYESLFDVPARAERDLISWTDQPTAVRVGRMGYRARTTVAGDRLEAEVFPIFGRKQAAMAREKKTHQTREAQERANHARSIRKMILLAEANFGREDIHLTLTYGEEEPDYERCQKDIRNFLARVKRAREKRGLSELKYIYVIEGGENGQRIHAHFLMNGGISREELEAIWKKAAAGGGYANADRLQPGNTGLDAIVTYMAKQLWARGMKRTGKEDEIDEIARFMTRHPGKRRKWSRSYNLKLPKVRTSDSRCSNARVRRIAQDFHNNARAEMEKVYPGYSFVRCAVYYSDVTDGVFIRCVMRRKGVGS